ncbi:MAG: hypothetical protein IPM74_05660 [Crocinitomicaceae bacterium]|nr:hypothetical protein [Crocinitomicaceae bacterium]MBK8925390.1 hypothetical protein [Crocinitomicaceae bacterium]
MTVSLFYALFMLNSCDHYTDLAVIKVVNENSYQIDSCFIEIRNSNESRKYVNIHAASAEVFQVNLEQVKGDGSFLIGHKTPEANDWLYHHFGYFTNGMMELDTITIMLNGGEFHVDYPNSK